MIDAGERAAMAESVRGALAEAVAAGADADAALAGLEWHALLAEEPDDAIEVVFGALGATGATSTALDDVLLAALGEARRAERAVLLPRFGGWEAPGRIDAGVLRAEGLATARAAAAADLVVVCGDAAQPRVASIAAGDGRAEAVHALDPDLGLRRVRAQANAAAAEKLDPARWQAAVALGQRALAQQIAGASRAMLDLAVAHARERVQFGRPIARFQAVRHRLAEALVAVEALDAALEAARETPDARTAALAKAVAGRTAHAVGRHCQQVLAGIGFTAEHPFHGFLKRALVLDGLFGSADAIALDVGRRLLAERRVPTLIEL